MTVKNLGWVSAFLLAVVLLAGCNSNDEETKTVANKQEETTQTAEETETEKPSLQLLEDEKAGSYLADADGKTLYYFTKDEPNASNCKGECLGNWPVFYAEDFDVPDGFNKDDFDSITRDDTGEKQTTYKGYPLYYFIKDQASGDVNGQGVKDVWYIVNADTDFKP